mmetsp:Transcript_45960/g.103277  ORF Transcript_45960/g.103277 Transcript_45960/m.103277 type:complete len:354 (-) Transcript_45960:75-1136(-)
MSVGVREQRSGRAPVVPDDDYARAAVGRRRDEELDAAVCPEGHALRLWVHKDSEFEYCCDACLREVDMSSVLWGCRSCDWDICAECHMRLTSEQVTAAPSLEVRVSNLQGTFCTLAADLSWRVCELKVRIQEDTGIPASQQRLLAGAVELQEVESLGTLRGGKDGEVLELTLLRRSEEQVQWLYDVQLDPETLQDAPAHIAESSEVVLAAVRQSGRAIEFAPEAMRHDRQVVLAAVSQDGRSLEHAAEDLRADRSIVRAAVRQNGHALEHACVGLRSDPEVVMEAVKRSTHALQYASESIRGDRDLVLTAIRADARALEYATPELQEKFSRFLPSGLRSTDRAKRTTMPLKLR